MKFSDGQSEFSRVFNFAILGYSRNSRKLDARENIVFYSMHVLVKTWCVWVSCNLQRRGRSLYFLMNQLQCLIVIALWHRRRMLQREIQHVWRHQSRHLLAVFTAILRRYSVNCQGHQHAFELQTSGVDLVADTASQNWHVAANSSVVVSDCWPGDYFSSISFSLPVTHVPTVCLYCAVIYSKTAVKHYILAAS